MLTDEELQKYQETRELLQKLSALLKVPVDQLPQKVAKIKEEIETNRELIRMLKATVEFKMDIEE